MTYISGCTDATFSSSKCPHKPGYPDQQWVALARCDGADIDLFSGCGHHKNETQIKHEDCTCDAASALISNPASGQSTLNQIALLPTTAGGTISFNPTALPTAADDAGGSGSSDDDGGGLSSGAKIGVGVGVGVGVPIIAAILATLFFLRRGKQKKAREAEVEAEAEAQRQAREGGNPDRGSVATTTTAARSPPPMYSADLQHQQQQQQGAGWYKPELHGESAHKSELPADDYAQGKETLNSVQNTPHGLYPPSELGGR